MMQLNNMLYRRNSKYERLHIFKKFMAENGYGAIIELYEESDWAAIYDMYLLPTASATKEMEFEVNGITSRDYVTGKFIVIEGMDGTGKTTVARGLTEYLNVTPETFHDRRTKATYNREPGGTSIGEKFRSMLLGGEVKEYGSFVEMMMFLTARDAYLNLITPMLWKGNTIISDRYIDSTLVYQVIPTLLDTECSKISRMLKVVASFAYNTICPDFTLYLVSDNPDELDKRVTSRGEGKDRFESSDVKIQYQRSIAYKALRLLNLRSAIINVTNKNEKQVLDECVNVMNSYFKNPV